MACFIAPAGVAIVTTVARKVVEKREKALADGEDRGRPEGTPGKWTQRLGWLNAMLWGGTVMLILDHILNGELVARPPFLTALQTSGQAGPVLREIAIVGGGMTAAVIVVWALMVLIAELKLRAKRAQEA
jgi:hypothetical protein